MIAHPYPLPHNAWVTICKKCIIPFQSALPYSYQGSERRKCTKCGQMFNSFVVPVYGNN
jgi:hypothetical protein